MVTITENKQDLHSIKNSTGLLIAVVRIYYILLIYIIYILYSIRIFE